MRLVRSCLTVFLFSFLFSASLWAADPFLGYWRLEPQRSAFGHQVKALTGGITFETEGAGYRFHEAIVFGEEKIARRWGTVQFGAVPKQIGEMVIHTSNVDATTFEVVYASKRTARSISRPRNSTAWARRWNESAIRQSYQIVHSGIGNCPSESGDYLLSYI